MGYPFQKVETFRKYYGLMTMGITALCAGIAVGQAILDSALN
ncbi:hypothetical protein KIPB_015364, partial [Kipferlia bialata]|eukprot:g15364.t1